MPHMDGFEACRAIKQDRSTRLIPVVLVTSLDDTASRMRGIEAGADDFISKPFNAPELRARVRSLLRIKGYTDELDSAESVIVSLALTIEARDSTTEGHCQRLAQYAFALGQALGLNDDDLSALARGGYLHDVGKIGIPDGVLLKPGPLTRDEYELIKQHPIVGERLCGELRSLRNVRPIVRHHHERLDGSGYPDGLQRRRHPAARADHQHRRRVRRADDGAAVPGGAADRGGGRGAPERSGARLAPRRAGRRRSSIRSRKPD